MVANHSKKRCFSRFLCKRFIVRTFRRDWQFHSEEEPGINDGKLVSLESLVIIDSNINVVFHLPAATFLTLLS
jgi:hypothetical protein